jgi:hypothetical protein
MFWLSEYSWMKCVTVLNGISLECASTDIISSHRGIINRVT